MCAGATREAAFWDTLHANTTRSSFGQDLDQNMMASASAAKEASKAVTHSNADRAATTPDEGSQSQRPDAKQPGSQSMKLSDASSRSSMNDTYDFLAEVEGGSNQLLPFLDEVGSTFEYNPRHHATLKREPMDEDDDEHDRGTQSGPQNSTPPEDEHSILYRGQAAHNSEPASERQDSEQPANEPEPADRDGGGSAPSLRRGLRPRSKPKQYHLSESEDSDGDWAPKRKRGSRKRGAQVKRERGGASGSVALSSSGLSGRQERPLPPDLDEKQRKRILRNRASAERSRLKRLGQIAMLEQENRELKQQLAEAQQTSAPNGGETNQQQSDVLHENSMLRAELKMMRDRVQTLTCLLTTANQRAAGEMLGC